MDADGRAEQKSGNSKLGGPPERALVTGAAGFIGSHLCEALVRLGCEVLGVDCFSDYYARELKEANLAGLQGDPRFRFIEADLLTADLGSLLRAAAGPGTGRPPVGVFHLAAQPGVRGSWGERFETYVRNNVLVTQRLLEACLSHGGARLVYASSSSVYGDQHEMPLHEQLVPAPVSPYGVTKLAAEHLCRLYNAVYGLPTVALRLFTVYGPRQRPDMAFSRFLRAAARGEPLQVFGDGRQTRDFTYVGDVVRAFLLASWRGDPGAVYNIAGGTRIALGEALDVLADAIGYHPVVERGARQPGDMRDTWADTARARDGLGFVPRVGLREGLGRQWEWQCAEHELHPAARCGN